MHLAMFCITERFRVWVCADLFLFKMHNYISLPFLGGEAQCVLTWRLAVGISFPVSLFEALLVFPN